MVGCPASGKSSFAKQYFIDRGGYIHVNRDTLKSSAACEKLASSSLSQGKSVVINFFTLFSPQSKVIDNTNPSPSDRAKYIKLAKAVGSLPLLARYAVFSESSGATVRLFFLSTSKDLAQHLNALRVVLFVVNLLSLAPSLSVSLSRWIYLKMSYQYQSLG